MANKRIMIVEDVAVVGLDLANRLESLGYDAAPVVPSGEEALYWTEKAQPDLVLMDIKLKGDMDGIDTADQIRQRFNIPVVYITSYADEQTLQRAKLTAPFGYLLKPFEDRELRAVIEIALYRHEMEAKLVALNTLAQEITTNLSLEMISEAAVRNVAETTKADFSVLFLVDGDTLVPKSRTGKSIDVSREDPSKHQVGECLCGLSLKQGIPIYSKDLQSDPRCTLDTCKKSGLHSFVCMPLKGPKSIIGVLGLGSATERDFELESSFLEAISNQVVIGLKNAILYEKVEAQATLLKRHLAEFKRAEEEKSKLQSQLIHGQKMEAMGVLAGGIAHDFNNVLSAIFGSLDLALTDIPKDSQAGINLQGALKAGHRAKELVNQIITFSRQGDQIRQPVRSDLFIAETLKLIRASLPTTIEIRQNIQTDIGRVYSSPDQIKQILMGLCTNAGQAMQEKGGILEVNLTEEQLDSDFTDQYPDIRPGIYQRLSVRDTGDGMTPHEIEHIFEPYYTTREKGKGSGLGLAVIHGIVSSHGGLITVQSEPGKGSTFDIYLPIIQEEDLSSETDDRTPAPTGNERILFIDDEQVLVDLGKRILEGLGYEVRIETSSEDALEVFKKQPEGFDLIITDMTMPHMTGDKLASELKKIRPDIPIVLCTGYSVLISEERAKQMGIREFLMKPLVMRDLAHTVRKVLDDK
jgi:CheY-like chemotaxis protein